MKRLVLLLLTLLYSCVPAYAYSPIPNCNGASNALTYSTSTNAYGCNTISGGGGTPGGSTNSIQYNNGSSFGGASTFVYSSGSVGIGTASPASTLDVYGGIDINGINGLSYPTSDSTTNGSIAIGSSSLAGQTTTAAYSNTAIGYQALAGTMTTAALANVAIGYEALTVDTSGAQNVAIGYRALYDNTTATQNIAIGQDAMLGATTGGGNFALGTQALATCGGCANNVAIGTLALNANQTVDSTVIGDQAVASGTGAKNVAIGYKTGNALTTGANDTFLGTLVGYGTITTGSNDIIIGTDQSATLSSNTLSNAINIGNTIYATNINNLNNTSGIGQIGIDTNAPGRQFDMTTSDSTVYATSSGSVNTPTSSGSADIRVNNTSATNTSAAYIELTTKNSSSNQQNIYIGNLSISGNMAPDIIMGTGETISSGAQAYQELFRLQGQNGALGIGGSFNQSLAYGITLSSHETDSIGVDSVCCGLTGQNLTIEAGGTSTGSTNASGGNLILESGFSTGNGGSGINFNVFEPAASGVSNNTATTAMLIGSSGGVAIGTSSTVTGVSLTMGGLFQLKQYTVSTLPSCTSTIKGSEALATDTSATCAYNSTPTGGSSTPCKVWCNGTAWVEG